nr:reverse transcriptase domain-containing protein [Tanacetum cinerariifolium]
IYTASTSGSGSLPSNTVANPKGELKAITTRSGLVIDGPTIPTPPQSINPEVDELVEETFTDPDLAEYTIKVPPPVNKLGLPELISTCMTLELANRAICTPAGIARDVFVPIGKFTFPADFVIVDYESDPRVPLILGRPFLRTARAFIDVHGEEMILWGSNVLFEKLLDLDSTKDLHPPLHDDPLSDSTTFSSNPLLEEFADELAFPMKYDDDLQFDIESDLKEIEFLLYQDVDSSLKNSIDKSNLANPTDNVVDYVPEMFTNEHALDYSSPPDFSKVDALPSTNNEDKIFNPGILIQEKSFEIITRVVQDKKLATSNASSMLEDFDPPLYEPLFFKEVPKMLLPFSSENKEKIFKPG